MIRAFLDNIDKTILKYLPLALLIASHILIMSQETSRMFWPYMVSSYIIAAGAYYIRKQKTYHASLRNYLFSKDVWLHQSAINDYMLFIFNYIVYFNFAAYLILHDPTYIEDWLFSAFDATGLPQSTDKPGMGVITAYTLTTLLLGELAYYITHRAYHEIPFLWELHKVHHSAEVMTPLTYIRSHPLDIIVQNFMRLFSITIASGIFLYFYPNIDGVITVASIDAGLFIYYLFAANLHHSNIWLSFGRHLEHIIISPAQHQIHHSTRPKHFDKNYGSALAIWDWIFGSLYIPQKDDEGVTFGLGNEEEQAKYDSTTKLLMQPLIGMTKIALKPRTRTP